MFLTNLVGYSATIAGTFLMVPQLLKLLRTKRTDGISLIMMGLYVVNCLLWLYYGFLLKAPPVVIANGIGGSVGVIQLILAAKYQRNTQPPTLRQEA